MLRRRSPEAITFRLRLLLLLRAGLRSQAGFLLLPLRRQTRHRWAVTAASRRKIRARSAHVTIQTNNIALDMTSVGRTTLGASDRHVGRLAKNKSNKRPQQQSPTPPKDRIKVVRNPQRRSRMKRMSGTPS